MPPDLEDSFYTTKIKKHYIEETDKTKTKWENGTAEDESVMLQFVWTQEDAQYWRMGHYIVVGWELFSMDYIILRGW